MGGVGWGEQAEVTRRLVAAGAEVRDVAPVSVGSAGEPDVG